MESVIEFSQMAGLAVVSVSLWTLRVALTSRARRVAGSLTAGVEAVVFVVAFSRVAADLSVLHNLLGYAVGVTAGTLLGVFLDERLSAGQSEVRVVTEGDDRDHIRSLRADGWPVTWVHGEGPNGHVTVAFVAVDDLRLRALVRSLKILTPKAFWTVERLKSARAGTHNPGWVQVGGTGLRVLRPSSTRVRPGYHVKPPAALDMDLL
ncbi:MAG: DUF5698 domain-containing protein [Actinomycetota bacterium]